VNPACIQWWAQDPDGRLYLYREMHQTQWTVERLAINLLDHVLGLDGEGMEPRPTAVITDHDAEGRATLEEKTGLETTAADKRVTIGLQPVRRSEAHTSELQSREQLVCRLLLDVKN